MVRCFVGIFLPEKVKNEIVAIQNELKKFPTDCKFVEFENLHICLSFLGEVDGNRVNEIKQKLNDIGKYFTKFDSFIHELKLIPSDKYVRVIALDVFDEQKNLIKLGKMIREQIGGDVKPPHVTLCRVKNIMNKPLFLEKVKNLKFDVGTFTVDEICLIKSELSRHGPVYSVLSEASLV
jgi:2'-5' RNA ligase